MRESKFYQLLVRETTVKHILEVLKSKFDAEEAGALTSTLQSITDLQRLDELLLVAVHAQTLDAFTQIIDE